MSWQNSFVPDNSAPQVMQPQRWQDSFVPDGQQPQTHHSSFMQGIDSFVQNPTWGKFGSAAKNALLDTTIRPLESIGGMVYGDQPIITNNFGETAGNIATLAMPFMAGSPNPASEEMAAVRTTPEEPGFVIPKSSDLKLIKEKLEMSGITPQQYADALMKSSPNDFAGELGGDALRMQTQTQAKITGPAMQEARDAMRERLSTAPQRVQQIIEQTFFPSPGIESTVGGDLALQKGATSPLEPVQQMQGNLGDIQSKLSELYDKAYNEIVPPEPFAEIINTPNGQTALKDTARRLANHNITSEQSGIVINSNNGVNSLHPGGVPARTIFEVSKSLGDLVKRNPLTGAIEDADSLTAEGQRQNITSYLAKNSPEFNTANANAAAHFQGQEAFDAGRKLAHAAAGEKADVLAQRANDVFSPQELSHRKAGYAQGLADAIQGTPLGGGNPASRIAKGTIQNTAADILQSPTQGQKLADALLQEKNRIDLAQRGLGGSNTAETLSANLPEVPVSPHGIMSAAASKVMDFVNAGKNERIAQLLYATSPEQKAILAKRILQ